MCAQDMAWDLLFVLQMSNLWSFQDRATKVYDMETTIANRRSKSSSSYEFKKGRGDTKKSFKTSKASTKETIATFVEELVRILGKPGWKKRKDHHEGMDEGSDLH